MGLAYIGMSSAQGYPLLNDEDISKGKIWVNFDSKDNTYKDFTYYDLTYNDFTYNDFTYNDFT
jgi:hypothetical protein